MNKKQKTRHRLSRLQASSGFTLIELMVVISIISMLASLTTVGVNNARKQARDMRKIKDMQVVRDALELYYQDKGYYPGYKDNTQAVVVYSTQTNTWGALRTELQPYLREWPNGFAGFPYTYQVRTIANVPSNTVSVVTPGCPSKTVNMRANSFWLFARMEDEVNNIQYRPGGENFWPGSSYTWYYMVFGGASTGAIYYTTC